MDLYNIRMLLNSGKSIYDLPIRVTYYARVSTDKDAQINSLQNQISYYEDFIKRNNNWEFIDGYVDEGISGTSVSKRDSFIRMINDGKKGKFDFVITKEISRFSRNTLDSIRYTQELLQSGIGVYFQSDNINTFLPDSELRLTIMSSIAQDEVRKLSERVKFGFKRSIENGIVLGNNKIWGYKKDNGKLVIDEEQAEVVRLIFELYATENLGVRTIITELSNRGYKTEKGTNLSQSTIKRIISNPKYKGYYCGNKTQKYDYRSNNRKEFEEKDWIVYKAHDLVPPIVSEELWNKANNIFKERSEKVKSNQHSSYNNKYTYSGKIVCLKHGKSYQRGEYKYPSGNKEIWRCREYADKGRKGCDMPIIYTTELNQVVKQCYDEVIKNRTDIIQDLMKTYSLLGTKNKLKDKISDLENKINDILKRKDKLLDLSIDGKISDSEFEIRNNNFNDEIEELNKKIIKTKEDDEKNSEIENKIESLRKIITKELDFSEGFDNSVVHSLIEKIEVEEPIEKNKINLKVYIKVTNENFKYEIERTKKNTSVCYLPYI